MKKTNSNHHHLMMLDIINSINEKHNSRTIKAWFKNLDNSKWKFFRCNEKNSKTLSELVNNGANLVVHKTPLSQKSTKKITI